MKRRTLPISICLTLATTTISGCGEDSTGEANTAKVELRDFAFDGVPRTVTAGTRITVTNTSAVEAHELTAFPLPDGEKRTVAELRALPPDQLGALFPDAPALAIAARPKRSGELILGDGTLQQPGRYLLVCFIPTGADPEKVLTAMRVAATNPGAGPPQIEGGAPHLTQGMVADLTVTP